MPIDFFTAPCTKVDGNCKKAGVVCIRTTTAERFGISDANSNSREPAFLDINNEDIWDLIIENKPPKEVTFKAVDFCVDIFREDLTIDGRKQLIKRCEGFLKYDDKIVFIEIKNRRTGNWIVDSCEKFIETIQQFRTSYPEGGYNIMKPLIANKMHTGFHQSEMTQKRKLKDAIGLDFIICSNWSID